MAMTLRLTDEQDAELEKLAAVEGVSKNEAVLRAIRARAEHLAEDDEVRRLTREAIERYGPLLDRLAR